MEGMAWKGRGLGVENRLNTLLRLLCQVFVIDLINKVQGNTFCRSQEHEFIKGDGTTTTFDTESWIKPILAEVDESTS